MQPHMQECLEPPEAGREKEGSSGEAGKGPANTWILDFRPSE